MLEKRKRVSCRNWKKLRAVFKYRSKSCVNSGVFDERMGHVSLEVKAQRDAMERQKGYVPKRNIFRNVSTSPELLCAPHDEHWINLLPLQVENVAPCSHDREKLGIRSNGESIPVPELSNIHVLFLKKPLFERSRFFHHL